MTGAKSTTGGLYRVIPVRSLPVGTTRREVVEATKRDCSALAERLDLPAVRAMKGHVDLTREADGFVHVQGCFAARVSQECVVSLEPFDADVEDEFDGYYGPPEALAAAEDFDPEDDRALAEPIDGGGIDLGELFAQHLSLSLDPHPRSPGAEAPVAGDDIDRNADPGQASATVGGPLAELKDLMAAGGKSGKP